MPLSLESTVALVCQKGERAAPLCICVHRRELLIDFSSFNSFTSVLDCSTVVWILHAAHVRQIGDPSYEKIRVNPWEIVVLLALEQCFLYTAGRSQVLVLPMAQLHCVSGYCQSEVSCYYSLGLRCSSKAALRHQSRWSEAGSGKKRKQ